jgi:Transposase DDE domain
VLTCGYDEAAGVATLAEYASKDCIASTCAMKNVICPKLLEIKPRRIRVRPPIGRHQEDPEHLLTVIHAQGRGTPQRREKIDWKLLTNLPVRSRVEAIEKLEWYSMRWKIETFHKILKSGWKAEGSRLRTAERLARLLAVICILSWRIFWLTMMNRAVPEASPTLVFMALEIHLLNQLVPAQRLAFHLPHSIRSLGRLLGSRR